MALAHSQEQQIVETNSHRQPYRFQGNNIFLTKDLPLAYANDASGQGHLINVYRHREKTLDITGIGGKSWAAI
jgi:hypothetical protein